MRTYIYITPCYCHACALSAYWFLSRVSILTRNIDIANMSVRPSVCPWRSGIRWKLLNISSHFFSYGSTIVLVLQASNIFTQFRWGHPMRGAKYRWGIKISRFPTDKSLYLANETKYRHSYHGGRIGTSMRSIKWCHFQWPWTKCNPVFKVTPLFDDKYLTNAYIIWPQLL